MLAVQSRPLDYLTFLMPQFFSLFLAPWRFRVILRQFIRREILGRYRGSLLGVGWAFITPLLMLAVYTFVFVGIFRARWPGAEEAGGVAFALRLFAGLMVFNMFAEVVGRAPSMVVEQPNLVKKVSFPLELLPFISIGSALFHFSLSATILLTGAMLVEQHFYPAILLLPLVVLPLLPLLLGLGWLLSALGVFVRDITPIVGLGLNLLLFLSPVFYTTASLSPQWQFWMYLNPLTPIIENCRLLVFSGGSPDWGLWCLSMGVSLVVACFGAWVFRAMREGFADVL